MTQRHVVRISDGLVVLQCGHDVLAGETLADGREQGAGPKPVVRDGQRGHRPAQKPSKAAAGRFGEHIEPGGGDGGVERGEEDEAGVGLELGRGGDVVLPGRRADAGDVGDLDRDDADVGGAGGEEAVDRVAGAAERTGRLSYSTAMIARMACFAPGASGAKMMCMVVSELNPVKFCTPVERFLSVMAL